MSSANTRRPGSRLTGFVWRWTVFAGCVLIWQLVATRVDSAFLPTPTAIASSAKDLWLSGPPSHLFLTAAVGRDILPSVGHVLGGWLLASVLGIVAGIMIGLSPAATDYTGTIFAFIRAMPPVMLVPVFLVLFHVGPEMQLATIAWGAIWPVLLNSIDGAGSVEKTKVDTARVFRVGRLRWVCTVVFPSALPKVFAGLRISLSISLVLMVISEMVGGINGLGYRVLDEQETFDLQDMWAGIAVLSALGYLLNRLLQAVEHRVLRWHRGSMLLAED